MSPKVHQGPIARFLHSMKMERKDFDAKLEAGDLAATIVFVGDVLYGGLIDAGLAVENADSVASDRPDR